MTASVLSTPQLNPAHRSVLSRLDLEAEQARQRFPLFVQQAWHVLEPQTPFVSGIHFDAICQHLQAVAEGRIKNLLINVPPWHAKSLLSAVFWPAGLRPTFNATMGFPRCRARSASDAKRAG